MARGNNPNSSILSLHPSTGSQPLVSQLQCLSKVHSPSFSARRRSPSPANGAGHSEGTHRHPSQPVHGGATEGLGTVQHKREGQVFSPSVSPLLIS